MLVDKLFSSTSTLLNYSVNHLIPKLSNTVHTFTATPSDPMTFLFSIFLIALHTFFFSYQIHHSILSFLKLYFFLSYYFLYFCSPSYFIILQHTTHTFANDSLATILTPYTTISHISFVFPYTLHTPISFRLFINTIKFSPVYFHHLILGFLSIFSFCAPFFLYAIFP